VSIRIDSAATTIRAAPVVAGVVRPRVSAAPRPVAAPPVSVPVPAAPLVYTHMATEAAGTGAAAAPAFDEDAANKMGLDRHMRKALAGQVTMTDTVSAAQLYGVWDPTSVKDAPKPEKVAPVALPSRCSVSLSLVACRLSLVACRCRLSLSLVFDSDATTTLVTVLVGVATCSGARGRKVLELQRWRRRVVVRSKQAAKEEAPDQLAGIPGACSVACSYERAVDNRYRTRFSLYPSNAQAKQMEGELMSRKASGFKTKAETNGRYGW
jgi:hypothetical protein